MAKFPKFDIKYTAFFPRKKEKTRKIQKEQSDMNRSLILKLLKLYYYNYNYLFT